jgi:prepilin-type N-terminal cleavage/methylation domain-containing protein/prepilin-type processing-associated H-X9-DG protein
MRNKDIIFRSRGFTLVELLVVISIIALLMAVLLPGLSAARRQAKNIKDMANLRQWGVMLTMFAQDNDGKLMVGWNGGEMWTTTLMKYYKGSNDIALCPMASTGFRSSSPPLFHFRGTDTVDQTFMPWGKFGVNGYPTNAAYGEKDGMYGSYGINGWVYDALDIGVPGTYNTTGPPDTRAYYWRNINVKNASTVPLFGDCMYDGGTPEEGDKPSPVKGTELNAATGTDMSIYCLDRHQGGINMTFMDGSVRKVGLKELWRLKWHRKFNTGLYHPPSPSTAFWPTWMQGLQDYPPI